MGTPSLTGPGVLDDGEFRVYYGSGLSFRVLVDTGFENNTVLTLNNDGSWELRVTPLFKETESGKFK
jgi:hypothetical protein